MDINKTQIYRHNVSRGTALWEALLVFSVKALICASIILPTGSIYGFNIKIALVVLICVFIGMDLVFKKKITRAVYSLFVWFGVVLLFILWGWLIATTNGVKLSSSFSQSYVILSTFVLILFPGYLVAGKIISPMDLLNAVMELACVYSLIKISMALLILLKIVSGTELFGIIENVFGYRGMVWVTNTFLRINFPSDYIFPIALFVSLTLSLRGKQYFFRGWIASGLFIIALILTYSRFLWFLGLFSIFVVFSFYFLFNWEKRKYLLLGFIAIAVSIIAFFGPNYGSIIYNYISERYFGSGAQFSDSGRVIMNFYLSKMALEKPIFGWGLGAYALNFVRFPNNPWLYELQWLSFFMQFGVLGVEFVFILLLRYIRYVFQSRGRVILGSGILFCAFLSVGFVNCFLLTSSAGVVYLFYFLIAMINWNNLPTSI